MLTRKCLLPLNFQNKPIKVTKIKFRTSQNLNDSFLKFINALYYADSTKLPSTDFWVRLETKKRPQNRVQFFQQFLDKDRVNSQCLTYKMREKLIRALPYWILQEKIEDFARWKSHTIRYSGPKTLSEKRGGSFYRFRCPTR